MNLPDFCFILIFLFPSNFFLQIFQFWPYFLLGALFPLVPPPPYSILHKCIVCIAKSTFTTSFPVCLHHRYTQEIPEPALSWFWHEAKIGVFNFSRNQNKRSSGVYVTCIYYGLRMKINTRKTRKDHGCICIVFVFACVVGKKPKTPNWPPMLRTQLHGAV